MVRGIVLVVESILSMEKALHEVPAYPSDWLW